MAISSAIARRLWSAAVRDRRRSARRRAAAKCWCVWNAAAFAIPTCTCRTAISISAAAEQLDITKDRTLPFTLGHEIAGVIEAAGDAADGAVVGHRVAVYPWIGCGKCAACRAGNENLCSDHHHLGVAVDGGYATHVLVPHPRYLLDYAPLSPFFAGPLMCSGLTAYAPLKRLAARNKTLRCCWSGSAASA